MSTLLKKIGLTVICRLGAGVLMLTQGCDRQAQEAYVLVAVGHSCDKWNREDEVSICCDLTGEEALREAIQPISTDDFKKEVMHRCLLDGNGQAALGVDEIRKAFQKVEFRLGHVRDMRGKRALEIRLCGYGEFPVVAFLDTCADTMVAMIQRHKVDWCAETRTRTEKDIEKQQKRLKNALHEMGNRGSDGNGLTKWRKEKEDALKCDKILTEYIKRLDGYAADKTPLAKVVRYAGINSKGKGRAK